MIAPGSPEHARIIAKAVGIFFNSECDQSIVRTEGESYSAG